jgi:PadR family transcriptional regulator PadR
MQILECGSLCTSILLSSAILRFCRQKWKEPLFFAQPCNLYAAFDVYIFEANRNGGKKDLLTRLEEAILVAVLKLGDNAYGVPINREVSKVFGRMYTMGGLYFALDQLVRKEYLMKRLAEPTPQRGGRSKTYYRLTPEGKEALEATRQHQIRLWKSVPEFESTNGS